MEALDLLRDQAAMAEKLMTQVFAQVTADQAAWRPEGSAANPIGSTFLHVYYSEDRLVHNIQGQPTIFEAGGWQDRVGFNPSIPWSPECQSDPDICRAYAAEVQAATRNFLSSLQPAVLEGKSNTPACMETTYRLLDRAQPDALEREINTPVGRRPMLAGLSLVLVIHKLTHLGDISAQLGCQGVKGFPF